jgi:hypothetical protein
MSKQIIILNGPPRIGKDTLRNKMSEWYKGRGIAVNHASFKEPLIKLTCDFYEFPRQSWDNLYEYEDAGGSWKDSPNLYLNGMTPREALIHVSENVIKPTFGKGTFGTLLGQSLKDGINIIADGGFTEEVYGLWEAIDYESCRNMDEIIIVKLEEEGFTFGNDSRSYISVDCDLEIVYNPRSEANGLTFESMMKTIDGKEENEY